MLRRVRNCLIYYYYITAECSYLTTVWTTDLAYRTWADDDVGAIHDVLSWMARPYMSGQWCMTHVTEVTSKRNCPKNHFGPSIFEDLYIHRHESGETHV